MPPSTNGDVADKLSFIPYRIFFGATNQGTVMVRRSILEQRAFRVEHHGHDDVLPNGTALISFAGIPNRTYLVEATTNLTPTIIWTTLRAPNTAGTNGLSPMSTGEEGLDELFDAGIIGRRPRENGLKSAQK